MIEYLKVGDTGYISWAYGVEERFQHSFHPMLLSEYVMAADSHHNLRTKLYAGYKAHRAEKRELDPEKEERYQRVREFQLTLWQDPHLQCWDYPGLEADDLVSLLAWRHGAIDLIGVDKDLFQLGEQIHSMRRVGGESVGIDSFYNKLQKGIQDTPRTPENIILLLALLGDKSDDVPRLIPPYSLSILWQIIHSKTKWHDAYHEFGLRFLLNLYLVTLPFPGLFGIQPKQLLDMVANNEWRPSNHMWARLELFHPKLYSEVKKYSGR